MSASWTTILSTNSCRSWGVNAVGSVYFFTIFRKLLTLTACAILGKTQFINGVQVKNIDLNAKTVMMSHHPAIITKELFELVQMKKSADVALTKDKRGHMRTTRIIPPIIKLRQN